MKTHFTPCSLTKRNLLTRIDDWLEERRRRDLEAYLATSENVFELETRMRALERPSLQLNY